MKRILLFLATNLAVILVLSVVARLTGLDRWLALNGSSYSGLLVMATLFGFGGALISLAMSNWMAKRAMGMRVTPQPAHADEQGLGNSVRALARPTGDGGPEVGAPASPHP